MQRADTIESWGNPIIKTPNLNNLVKEGTSFLKCYTPSPVCVSARCSLHYGLYPSNTGCYDNGPMKPDEEDSYVQQLSKAGYYTHSIGKCHFTPNPYELRGFHTREIQEEISKDPKRDDYLSDLFKFGYSHITDPHGVRGEMYYIPQVSQMPAELHPTNWVGEKSTEFIKRMEMKNNSWLLFSSFIHPHPPFALPAPWHKIYRSPDMPLPNVPQNTDTLLTSINKRQNRYKYRDQGLDNNLIKLIKAYYYGCISYVDFQIGKIIKTLKITNQLENTVIIFTSDHGEHLGDYNSFGKRSMHSTSSRIPLIVSFPGVFPKNVKITNPTSLIDIAKTCLALGGIKGYDNLYEGENLLEIAKGNSERKYVFSQWNKGKHAQYMCVSKSGLYFYSAEDDKEFYFNHLVDPNETENRAYLIGENQKVVKGMREQLLKHLKENNESSAFEEEEGRLLWKKHKCRSVYEDPQEGLIYQDHPWATTTLPFEDFQ